MMERCVGAMVRIKGIAESARTGLISESGRLGDDWEGDANYMKATSWDLLVPVALFRIGQQKLTGVDMSVDKATAWQYLLARELYSSWGIGPELAAENPALRHNDKDSETRQYILSN